VQAGDGDAAASIDAELGSLALDGSGSPDSVSTCPGCGADRPPSATGCPDCGLAFVSSLLGMSCPRCGAAVWVETDSCPSCGRLLPAS
jgi:Double zinc ribbon